MWREQALVAIATHALAWAMLSAGATAFAADEPAVVMSAAECEVWWRELSFARSVDAHDPEAFAEHIVPDAVFNAATASPLRGRDNIVRAWMPLILADGVEIVWRPAYVSIAGDTDVAASRGPYYVYNKKTGDYEVGVFGSVWVRDPTDQAWRVSMDGLGEPGRQVADRGAALEFLADAPQDCPRT